VITAVFLAMSPGDGSRGVESSGPCRQRQAPADCAGVAAAIETISGA